MLKPIGQFFLLIALTLLSFSLQAKPRHEVGMFGGPYLDSGVDEVMQSVGGRFGLALTSNHISHLELRGFAASNETGDAYQMGEISIRNEMKLGKIAPVWLIGIDYHRVKLATAREYTTKNSWHAGVGINLDISKNLSFRNDFITRFSQGIAFSGISLSVSFGLSWAFGSPES